MRSIVSFLFVFAGLVSPTVSAQVYLDSCQARALQNYPLIKQYELIAKSKEYSLANANKSYLPQFDVSLIGGILEGLPTITLPGQPAVENGVDLQFITMLQLNQVIWDGGITKARKTIIEATAEIEKAELEVSLFALENRVNNLFFGILLIDEQIKNLELLSETLARNKARVEVAVENGTAFSSDLDEIQVQIIKAKQKIDELRFNRVAFLQVLSLMTGSTIDSQADFIRPELITDYMAQPINRPELSVINNRLGLIQAQQQIQKATLFPKIGIMGFATFIQPGVDFGTSQIENVFLAGVSLNWNIAELYRHGNNKKLTEVNLGKLTLQRETFLFNTNLSLAQLDNDLQKLASLIGQDKELVALKEKIRRSYEVKYENGVVTMSALLDQVNEASMAEQQLIMHEIQYLMKLYEYQNKSGN